MKKIFLLLVAVSLTGCGHYSHREPLEVQNIYPNHAVAMSYQTLSRDQEKKILGSSLDKSNVRTVHITMVNDSNEDYRFSMSDIGLPLVSARNIFLEQKLDVYHEAQIGGIMGFVAGFGTGVVLSGGHPEAITLGAITGNLFGMIAGAFDAQMYNDGLYQALYQNDSKVFDFPRGAIANFIVFVPANNCPNECNIYLHSKASDSLHTVTAQKTYQVW